MALEPPNATLPEVVVTAKRDPSITPSGDYRQRRIDVLFDIGKGQNGEEGYERVTVRGLRVIAQIEMFSSDLGGFSTAQVQIYGLPFPLLNRLSTMGRTWPTRRRNGITLMAGDAWSVAKAYQGEIGEAWADLNTAPDVSFIVSAFPGAFLGSKPADPTSVDGEIDAVLLLQQFAAQLGYGFENAGVPQTMLEHPYLPGTTLSQIETVAAAAHISWAIEHDTLVIVPKAGSRNTPIPLISARTGMVGYPSYAGPDLRLKTIYNPGIKFLGTVDVVSDSGIDAVDGQWIVHSLTHDLASEEPDGPWFTNIECHRLGQTAGLPQQR